ncbi:HTH-type transcriptional regulator MalT [compost metagenome]
MYPELPGNELSRLPALPSDHLPRPRLTLPLLQGAPRLRLLAGSPGSGKSVLLRECAEFCPPGTDLCWLDLHGRAIEVAEFIERLAGALAMPAADIRSVGSFLADRDRPLWIMLDNFPHMPCEALDSLLNHLLQMASPQVGWWVSSRRRPAWQLPRLLLSNDLCEVDARQLALTGSELAELVGQVEGGDRQTDTDALMQRTRGWCAAVRLHLVALSAASAEQLLQSYLEGELLAPMPAPQRETLCMLACLPSFDESLYRNLLAPDERRPLGELLDAGAFVEPLQPADGRYRVHPAAAPLLAANLPESRRTGLYRQACQYFAARDDVDHAIRFALLAGQAEMAASLLERYALDALLQGDGLSHLLQWRDELPGDLLQSTPRLVMLMAWTLLMAGRLEEAQDSIDELKDFLARPGEYQRYELLAQWQVLSGQLAHLRGHATTASSMVRAALPDLPKDAWAQRAMAHLLLIDMAYAEGRVEEAQRLGALTVREVRANGNLPLEGLLMLQYANHLEQRGELSRAQRLLARVVAELGGGAGLVKGRALIQHARILWRQGRVAAARESCSRALEVCLGGADPAAVWAHLGLAELEAAQGRLERAFEHIGEATRTMQLRRVSESLYLPQLELLRGKLWLLQGQHERCARLATHHLEACRMKPGWRFAHAGLDVRRQFALLHARARSAAGEDVSGVLEGLLEQVRNEGSLGQACELWFALSESHLACGRQRKAQAALLEGLAQARRMGGAGSEYQWQALRPELGRWMARNEPDCGDTALVDVGQLSRRERSVLEMIAEGLANQEIAERLHISLHTVKSHAQRINNKLGVSRRTQAIVRAKELGLVS